jgi:hypothetical protein
MELWLQSATPKTIVCVKWDKECLNPGEPSLTKEKLLSSKWNPNKAMKGAWRQFFGENNA